MAEAFTALQTLQMLPPDRADSMRKTVGFSNIVVHDYQEIDWGIVFHICHHQLDDFRAFAQAIVASLPEYASAGHKPAATHARALTGHKQRCSLNANSVALPQPGWQGSRSRDI